MDLPTITDRQQWCCANGCGVCRPVQIEFEYSRTEDMDGNLIESMTEKVWASHCCGADLELWDEEKDGFVEWMPPNVEVSGGERSERTPPVGGASPRTRG